MGGILCSLAMCARHRVMLSASLVPGIFLPRHICGPMTGHSKDLVDSAVLVARYSGKSGGSISTWPQDRSRAQVASDSQQTIGPGGGARQCETMLGEGNGGSSGDPGSSMMQL